MAHGQFLSMKGKKVKCLQYELSQEAKDVLAAHYGRTPSAFVRSFGCQQNVNDAERIKGALLDLGFVLADAPENADLILFNTCAVREHAEQRVFGNIGALKSLKQAKPGLLIGICGCMALEKATVEKLRESYPHVDIILGPNPADVLGKALMEKITTRRRALRMPQIRPEIVEEVPLLRESAIRAFLPIMYGCDNFCSYCIVPYVRGRERSRLSEDILKEFSGLVEKGYKDITLLGQNVNSYGKGNDEKLDFSDLLELLCKVPGQYRIRFMTSHPKDATRKMIDTIVANPQLCKHLHLPVQSGSNEILTKMNRRYTAEEYVGLIRYAKQVCPEMAFSSDVMVGFPGETEEDFEKTKQLVREVGFAQLFTFIYSRRPGTEAAEQPDSTPHSLKSQRIMQLLKIQEEAVQTLCAPFVGKSFTALAEGCKKEDGLVEARLDNNMQVQFLGNENLVGSFVQLKITGLKGAVLQGELKA